MVGWIPNQLAMLGVQTFVGLSDNVDTVFCFLNYGMLEFVPFPIGSRKEVGSILGWWTSAKARSLSRIWNKS